MKKTPWFDGSVKPVRKGVYQVDWCDGDPWAYYSYWDGRLFNGGWVTADGAYSNRNFGPPRSGNPKRWRGLTKPPKGTE